MLESRARWAFVNPSGEDKQSEEDVLRQLLSQRGLQEEDEIKRFLSPNLKDLVSPKNLVGIDKVQNRIKNAIKNKEKILIYGDYDADGVTSTALLLKTFQELGALCDFYIPNRFLEGYGLNKEAIQSAKESEVKVIITVDNGIASFEEISFAKELGIDVIITDHHDIQGKVPDAFAIIHTELSPAYSFKFLAGVGIAFKLAEALLGYFPKHLLDLVAIGTIADLVPLIGENRILAYHGLKELSVTNNIGLSILKQQCSIIGTVTEEDVGFRIGPRINAVGRLENASLAVELLMSDDTQEAKDIVEEIESLNSKRQELVHSIVEEAEELIDHSGKNEIIFLSGKNWHEGVLGIVASRLVQKYYRPTFILSLDESTNTLKGSARSIEDFHLFDHCIDVKYLFTSFGGHSQAAGMTLPAENEEELIKHLNKRLAQLPEESLQEKIVVSQSLEINTLSKRLIHEIYKLAPFGMENPKPIFHLKAIPKEINQIGRDQSHLKIQYMKGSERIESLGFSYGHFMKDIAPQTPLSIVGELNINEWNGFETIQMIIRDMKIEEWQLFDHRGKQNIDISHYIRNPDQCLLVGNPGEQFNHLGKVYDYNEALDFQGKVMQLILLELPDDLKDLESIVKTHKPEQIHVKFQVEKSLYLQAFPSRDDFKWLYGFIHRTKTFDVKEGIPEIMQLKKWSKDWVIFMLHVFNDLNFIVNEEGIIKLTENPDKRDLFDSKVYQDRQEKAEIEKLLNYTNYKQLKQLFTSWYSE